MTMTKKRLFLLASLPLVIAVALGVLAMLPPSPGVTKANFNRIEIGMTIAEVEAILGGPANTPAELPYWDYVTWFGEDDTTASIRINIHDHRVYAKTWTDYKLAPKQR